MWYAHRMTGPRLLRLLSTFTLLSAFGALACDQSDAKADTPRDGSAREGSAGEAVPPTQKSAPAAAAQTGKAEVEAELSGQQAYDEQSFALELQGPDAAKVGQPVQLSIVLAAQNGFKVNDEYPAKFEFASVPGVKPKSSVVRRADAKVTKTHCEMPLEVTFSQPGKHRVGGKMSFSVCTDDRCLIEKRDLLLEIEAR